MLHSHSTLCAEKTRVLSGLVNSIIIQIMSMTNSTGFWPRLYSSRAAEEGSGIFWIMIEFTHLLYNFKGMLEKPQPTHEIKG